MALLTGDIVWLVNTTVKMPDGSQQTVLVPQVYAKVKPGDLDGSGALIAGNNVNIKLDGDLFNSGTLNGRRVLQLDADTIINQTGTLSGDDVRLNARNDINNIGGIIRAAAACRRWPGGTSTPPPPSPTPRASAARTASAAPPSTASPAFMSGRRRQADPALRARYHSQRRPVVASGERGEVQLVAGRDTTLTGAQVSGDKVVMDVGRNLTLTSEQDSDRYDSTQQNASAGAASPSVRCPAPPASTSARTRCTAITIRWRSRPASLPAKAAMTSPSASIPGWMAR